MRNRIFQSRCINCCRSATETHEILYYYVGRRRIYVWLIPDVSARLLPSIGLIEQYTFDLWLYKYGIYKYRVPHFFSIYFYCQTRSSHLRYISRFRHRSFEKPIQHVIHGTVTSLKTDVILVFIFLITLKVMDATFSYQSEVGLLPVHEFIVEGINHLIV